MVQVTIIVPVHNERENLPELARRVSQTLKKTRKTWELLLVDDLSNDGSREAIRNISEENKNIRGIFRKVQGGQTGALKSGFDHAKGNVVITIDGDLQLMPEDIPLFLDKIDNGYDVVNGIREHRKHVFSLRLVSRVYNLLMLLMFNCPVIDAASNYTAFRADLVKNLRLKGNDHRYLIPIVVRRGAKVIGEVVVRHQSRKRGKSKYKLITKLIKGGPEIVYAWLRINNKWYEMKKK